MSKYRIIRENGKVCIEDDFTTSLTYDDDTQLEEKIKTNPRSRRRSTVSRLTSEKEIV